MNIFNKNNYHFIGIGGIGISAIARMLQMQGKNVSGSDSAQSEITDDLANLGINVAIGQSKYLVVEACEYKRSFLNLTPQILVITNIETDHLDYYKNIDDIRSAFGELEAKVPKDGFVIKNSDYTQVKTDFDLLIPGRHNILNAQAAIKAVESLGI